MANTFVTSKLVSENAVALLASINSFIRLGNREYESMFKKSSYAPGNTIDVRLDNFVKTQRGNVVTADELTEASVPVTIEELFSATIAYQPEDLNRDIISFSNEFIEPAVRSISNQMNKRVGQLARTQIGNFNGDISAPLNTFKSISDLNPQMNVLNMNNYQRNLVIDSYSSNAIVSSSDLKNSFLPKLNEDITFEASLGGRLARFEMFEDTTLEPHITGTHEALGDITVAAPIIDGNTIVLTGLVPGATFKEGDLLSFEGVYAYNSVGQAPLRQISKQLTVTADATAGGLGDVQLTIFPPLISTGTRQNYFTPGAAPNQIPANTVVNFVTNFDEGYSDNVAFTTKGMVLCMPPLAAMATPQFSTFTDPKSGISMRTSQDALVLENKNIFRIDAQIAVRWIDSQCVRKISKNAF